jgi:hypothetical protein
MILGIVRRLSPGMALAVALACVPSASAAEPGAMAPMSEALLPGGITALLGAADIPDQPDPVTAMLAFVRVAHGFDSTPSARALQYLDAIERVQAASPGVPGRADAGSTVVPLPLSAEVWITAVFRRPIPFDRLATAILRDRRAALLYYGLMALDDDTLTFLGNHPALLTAITDRSAGAFAEWGRSIRVSAAGVEVPGGPGASALWQALVGHAPSDPAGFIRALLERDGGRAAFFYDTIAHLDPARQAFALGGADASDRVERFRVLYGVFATTRTFDSSGAWPVVRHPFNPAAALREVTANASGEMSAPASRVLWDAVFSGSPSACARADGESRPVDAAWLVDRIERENLDARGGWLGAVTFAQRVFGRATPDQLPAVCEVAAAYPRDNGLLLTLERMGLDKPAEYVAALEFANGLWAGGDRWAAVVRTAQAQGVLAVLERAVSSRSLSPASAQHLLESLTVVDRNPSAMTAPSPAGDASMTRGAIARWVRDTLLPAVCAGQPSADRCLIALASGAGRTAGVVSWEDERYHVDPGAGTAVRIERVLRAQRATRIDDGLNVMAAAAILGNTTASAADLDRAATILKALKPSRDLDLAELFGHAIAPMRVVVDAGADAAAGGGNAQSRADAAAALVGVGDTLLADALVSLSYAMAVGDPDDAVLMAGNLARRHLFDGTLGPATAAWHTPEEVQALDKSWLVEGSTLMLRIVYSRSWLRRLSIQDPGQRPRPDPRDVRGFGETAATFSPFDLTDASRDAIVSAIGRGRARIAELVATPGLLWKTASEVGLGEWRCRAALWAQRHADGPSAAEGHRAASFFSLSELMRLGRPEGPPQQLDAWGVATRSRDGGPWVRMPHARTWEDLEGPRGVGLLATEMVDVHLRVAEALSELKLPAALAPDIAAYAAWDAMTAAPMSDPDDWFALARGAASIPADRFLDYVSALTAIGPLVPVR